MPLDNFHLETLAYIETERLFVLECQFYQTYTGYLTGRNTAKHNLFSRLDLFVEIAPYLIGCKYFRRHGTDWL
jgi:hypothetical protein